MSILNFEKPKKIHSTEEHNKENSSYCDVEGTYVPNMSENDMLKWKAKHIKGDNERIEIRKTFKYIEKQKEGSWWGSSVQSVIIVFKNRDIKISFNGTAKLTSLDWNDFINAINEAKTILGLD